MRARDNPFASHRVLAVRYRLRGTSWEALLQRFDRLGRRAALVGPEGAGKTTLLEELGRRLGREGLRVRTLTLRRGHRRLAPTEEAALLDDLGGNDLLLVDGADQLGRLARRRLRRLGRAAGGLLVTSHREGLLPTLHRCATTPALLEEIVGELLGGHCEAGAGVGGGDLGRLFERHHGDLRAALRELYDRWAGRE